jgi:hypothetical protein
MLVGPDESYRLDKRFSCTVNCETEKDKLWEFGGVGDGDGGVAGGLLVEMAGVERGMLVCRNRIPPFGKGMVPVLFCRIFVNVICPGQHS